MMPAPAQVTPMRRALPSLAALLLLGPGAAIGMTALATPARADDVPPALDTRDGMRAVLDGYFRTTLDRTTPIAVRGLVLRRDAMTLTLASGTVWFAQPIAGRVAGAWFSGEGTLRVSPPNPVDRRLLAERYGRPEFEEAIDAAALRFDDGTESELRAGAAAPPGPGAGGDAGSGGDPAARWEERQKIDFNATSLQMDYLENALNRFPWASTFAVDARARGGAWYGFSSAGRRRIEDALYRERATAAAGKRSYEALTLFHRPADYDAHGDYDLLPAADAKETAILRHVEMTIDIPDTRTLHLDAKVTVEAAKEGLRAVRFDLTSNLDGAWYEPGRTVAVEGVADADDHPLPFVHACDALLVLLPAPIARGEKVTLRVRAAESTIIQLTEKSYWIFTDTAWYPKIGPWGGRHTFAWTFRVVKPLRVAASGLMVREWSDAERNCARFESTVPARLPSFIFGELQATDGAYTREPPGVGRIGLKFYGVHGGESHFRGNAESILFNITQGLKAYEAAFGPYPFRELDLAEIAPQVPFAQSPAGILLLPAQVAGTSGAGGLTDQVIYHELAHQWWGQNVGTVGPEDDWISESWAEYSAGLVTDAIDPKKFRVMRDGWRRLALEGDAAGTIATAWRIDPRDAPKARTALLYGKGPAVVHMLRTWMGWEKFSKYVAAIQSTWRGQDINTDTLAREAGKVMGYDMFPFFDQWVRDRGIPKVRWSWSIADEPDGKKLLTITTRQEDAARVKVLMLPIAIDFGNGAPTRVEKPILEAQATVRLILPAKPKSVVLDPDEDLLATFVREGGAR